MAEYENQWGNDSADINNLNRALGSQKKDKQQQIKDKERAIDIFYPFAHTARIEQLFVMETTSKEQLPKNLVTAGERAEYAEFGIKYGLKESIAIVVVFLLALIIQTATLLKYPSDNTSYLSGSIILASIIPISYGLAYTFHIAKYNVGHLTSKVINALLAGRLIIVGMVVFVVGWGLLSFESYIYANTSVILTTAETLVPDADGSVYVFIKNALSYIMIPFGGSFMVTEQSVAYAMTVIIPELFLTWKLISIFAIISLLAPMVTTGIFRQMNDTRDKKAQTELENY
jgi:hypothetical protein